MNDINKIRKFMYIESFKNPKKVIIDSVIILFFFAGLFLTLFFIKTKFIMLYYSMGIYGMKLLQ